MTTQVKPIAGKAASTGVELCALAESTTISALRGTVLQLRNKIWYKFVSDEHRIYHPSCIINNEQLMGVGNDLLCMAL